MGIQRNFIFNSILTVSNYIFPFILYPYVARVLGVENIGAVNYVNSMIDYSIIFSTLGLTIVGVRQISKAGADRRKRDAVFSALFTLCLFFTVVTSAALVTLTYTLAKFQPYRPLLLIGLIKLWGNLFLINWLYQGLEDFKFITIRTILVKMAYVASVFIFIHRASDYTHYFLLLCMMYAVNAAVNCYVARRYVSFKPSWQQMKTELRPLSMMGLYLMLNSMYLNFNVIYLGWKCGDTEVGYYTTTTKIFQIILALYTAYSTVVMPRACALLEGGKIDEFKGIIRQSSAGLMMIAVPAALFMMIFTEPAVVLFVGPQYLGSITPMRIVMPLLFIIGYEQILIMQILTPLARDRQILTNAAIGAATGLTLNLLLVPHLQAVGSAIVWVCAETAVLISAQRFVSRDIELRFPWRELWRNIAAYIPFIVIALAFSHIYAAGNVLTIAIWGATLVAYFVLVQKYILRAELYNTLIDKIAAKIPALGCLKS